VYISSSIPSIGASTTPVLFGAFKNVALAYQGLGLTILREKFADQNLLGFPLYSRTASKLMVPNSLRSLKLAAS
jgi:HK97 family phage major capsid protein